MSPKSENFIPTNSSISPRSTPVNSARHDDSYNSRYQMSSHSLLAGPSDNIVTTASSGACNEARSPGKSMLDTRADTFDSLVTSVTSEILSKSEKVDNTSSANCLNSLISVPHSSPSTQPLVNSFPTSISEVKTTTLCASEAQSKPPQSPPQPKDISFSTKTEDESKLTSQLKSPSVPLTVKEISEAAQKIGDMIEAGPPPPITGMVPQEMVKMTDNDLISYINPSCFDQG